MTGDCLYTLRHLATAQVQAFRLSRTTGEQQVDSVTRIAGLQDALQGLHLLVGHDHTEYQWKHLIPYLSKGWLSEDERRALLEYRSRLFERDRTLRAGALPQFRRGTTKTVGTVSEPELARDAPRFQSRAASGIECR